MQRGRRETAEAFPLDRRRRLHGDERRRARHLRGLLLGGGLVFGAELAFGGGLSFCAELAFGAEEQGEPALHTTARPAFSRLGQRAAGVNAGLIGVCACRKSERKDRRRTEKLAQAPGTPWWRRRCPRLQQRRGPPAAWTRAFLSARTSRAKCEGVLALIIAHGSDYGSDARLMISEVTTRALGRKAPQAGGSRSAFMPHPRASARFRFLVCRYETGTHGCAPRANGPDTPGPLMVHARPHTWSDLAASCLRPSRSKTCKQAGDRAVSAILHPRAGACAHLCA